MSLDSCIETLSKLSNSELVILQAKIQEEAKKRIKRRFMSLLESWATGDPTGTARAIKYVTHQTTQGWLVVLMVFHGTRHETFTACNENQESAEQLAAEYAVKRSQIITDTLPLPPGQPMEIM